MIRTPFLRALLLCATVAAPAAAQLPPLFADFSEYASPITTEYQATVGSPVRSGDFDVYAAFGANSRNVLGTWGQDPELDPTGYDNLPANLGGATTVFGTRLTERIDLYRAGEDPFSPMMNPFYLYSIDVAHLFDSDYLLEGSSLSPITLTFFAFAVRGANATFSRTFTIPAPTGGEPMLTTLDFGSNFFGYSFAWQQGNTEATAHQFTNIRGAVVPEPSTYVLLATGMLVVGVVGRRRAQAA